MHVFALELYLIRRKDQYDNIVAMVTGMLCALPVTIYFKQECSPHKFFVTNTIGALRCIKDWPNRIDTELDIWFIMIFMHLTSSHWNVLSRAWVENTAFN